MIDQENNRMDALLRSEPAPGNRDGRMARLLAALSREAAPSREISRGDVSHRAHRRARASVKLSMASAILAASLLLALGVGLGRVGTPAVERQVELANRAHDFAPTGLWADTLDKSRRLTADRVELLARAGKAKELASLGPVYGAMAAELVREAAECQTGPARGEALANLADALQRDGSRFARLAAESPMECRDALASLAAEAGRQSARARDLAG